jgi:hypothetical protein
MKKIDLEEVAFKPTQVPTHVTRDSYQHALMHCMTFRLKRNKTYWGCARTGERMSMRMVIMNLFDRDTGVWKDRAPVGTLYCPVCDQVPGTHKNDSIFIDQVQTLAV